MFGWWLALLVVAVSAKLALLGLRVVDDGQTGIVGGWGALALVTEDLRLATVFALFVAVAGLARGPRVGGWPRAPSQPCSSCSRSGSRSIFRSRACCRCR